MSNDKDKSLIRKKADSISSKIDWDSMEQSKQAHQAILDGVQAVKEHIEKHPDTPKQKLFSFMPTDMARISPFFPISKRQMKDRIQSLEWEHNWGKITFKGEQLSIFDETVLLSLLYLVAKNKTEDIETTKYELCKIGNVAIGKNPYKAVMNSIERLASTFVKIEIWKRKGKDRKLKEETGGTIIAFYHRVEETGKLQIAMNPYFIKMFGESLVTNIDLNFRLQLKSDISKALYRFYRSQKSDHYQCHMLTLAKTINLNTDQEVKRIRERIRTGLRELRKQGYLDRWTFPKGSEIINIWKAKKSIK